MKLYFLVEGKRTEFLVYPKWLSFLLPNFIRISSPDDSIEHGYFIVSGEGYPRLLDVALSNSIKDIVEYGDFNALFICLDSDDNDIDSVVNVVNQSLESLEYRLPSNVNVHVIVQSKCIESWFMGNRKVFPMNPQSLELKEFIGFYNVYTFCPELMTKLPHFDSIGSFHFNYFKMIMKERNLNYSKRSPSTVVEKYFYDQLVKRIESGHLRTFGNFISTCSRYKTTD